MIKASEGGGGKGIRKCSGPDEFEHLFRLVKLLDVWHLSFSLNRFRSNSGSNGSSWFTDLSDEICRQLPASGSADPCRSKRTSDILVRSRLHHPTTSPEDHWRSTGYYRTAGNSRANGEGRGEVGEDGRLCQVDLVFLSLIGFSSIFVFTTSAGTIEYLYNPNDQSFFFLELNPRLQVEHPCTEMVTDVNLPACQLQVGFDAIMQRSVECRMSCLQSNYEVRKPFA